MFLGSRLLSTLPAALAVYPLLYFPADAQWRIASAHCIAASWAARAVELSKVRYSHILNYFRRARVFVRNVCGFTYLRR